MKNVPKKLKIGGHTFKIILKKMEDDNGETDWKSNTITIDEEIPQNHKMSTIIHEAFHVLNPTIDSQDMGHALLCSLSEQFYQVLVDNQFCFCKCKHCEKCGN